MAKPPRQRIKIRIQWHYGFRCFVYYLVLGAGKFFLGTVAYTSPASSLQRARTLLNAKPGKAKTR